MVYCMVWYGEQNGEGVMKGWRRDGEGMENGWRTDE